jgi:hypothetical protein
LPRHPTPRMALVSEFRMWPTNRGSVVCTMCSNGHRTRQLVLTKSLSKNVRFTPHSEKNFPSVVAPGATPRKRMSFRDTYGNLVQKPRREKQMGFRSLPRPRKRSGLPYISLS